MLHKIKKNTVDILVMVYHGDMLPRLEFLLNRTELAAFKEFYTRWISDAPTYEVVDHRSNLSTEIMKEKLHAVETQLVPVQTEAHWNIGLKEDHIVICTRESIVCFSKLTTIPAISAKYFLPT